MVHRDIKPENILIDSEGNVKLVDLGLARKITSTQHGLGGSPGFIAPESFDGAKLTYQSDVFSVGVILYVMLAQEFPYTIHNSN